MAAEELAATVDDQALLNGQLHERLREAEEDRDAAQHLVEALWPANLLAGSTADRFALIAAIVAELGRPLGEWTASVESSEQVSDDGVQVVALYRISGRTS